MDAFGSSDYDRRCYQAIHQPHGPTCTAERDRNMCSILGQQRQLHVERAVHPLQWWCGSQLLSKLLGGCYDEHEYRAFGPELDQCKSVNVIRVMLDIICFHSVQPELVVADSK
jgi:hypothetical protein